MPSRKQIRFGETFTLTVNNAREQEFEVLNFHDQVFDRIICEIRNTTSYPPPDAYITDKENGIIKLQFSNRIPASTGLELLVQGGITQKIEITEKKVLLDAEAAKKATKQVVSSSLVTLKKMAIGFIIASICLWLIKGTHFGDFIINLWGRINAAQVIQAMDEYDPRILTNKHPVYESAAFAVRDAIYKTEFKTNVSLREIYNFVGNGFFVSKDLIKQKDGNYKLATKSEADDICELMGGRLLSVAELKNYLAGQFLTIENFVWPIYLRPLVPEWSGTKESWDNYWLYLKSAQSSNTISESKFISADDGDVEAAFRCSFEENYYIQSKKDED